MKFAETNASKIRTRSVPRCRLCGNVGETFYSSLSDCLFGTPGVWNVSKCLNTACGLAWLNPMPTEKDIGKAYWAYYTHSRAGTDEISGMKSFTRAIFSIHNVLTLPLGLRHERLQRSLMYLYDEKPKKLLEVGCGNGAFLDRMPFERLGCPRR